MAWLLYYTIQSLRREDTCRVNLIVNTEYIGWHVLEILFHGFMESLEEGGAQYNIVTLHGSISDLDSSRFPPVGAPPNTRIGMISGFK